MLEWLKSLDWKFIIGDIVVPIGIFIAGCFVGAGIEHHKQKANAKIKGDGNTVIQNSKFEK